MSPIAPETTATEVDIPEPTKLETELTVEELLSRITILRIHVESLRFVATKPESQRIIDYILDEIARLLPSKDKQQSSDKESIDGITQLLEEYYWENKASISDKILAIMRGERTLSGKKRKSSKTQD